MHLFGKLIALLFIGFQIVGLTYGSSIDCANTQDRIEKMVCASPSARIIHDRLYYDLMDTIFGGRFNHNEINEMINSKLKEREKCKNVNCIVEFYNNYEEKHVFVRDYDISFSINYHNLSDEVMLHNLQSPTVPDNDPVYNSYNYIVVSLHPDDGTSDTYARAEYQLCEKILQYINNLHWRSRQPDIREYATRVLINFPELTPPPWTDLNPRDHLELIGKIEKIKEKIHKDKFNTDITLMNEHIGYKIDNIKLQTWNAFTYIYKNRINTKPKNIENKHMVRIIQNINEEERSRIMKYSEGKPIMDRMDIGEIFFVTPDLKNLDPDIPPSSYVYDLEIMLHHGLGYFISSHIDLVMSNNLEMLPFACSYYYHSRPEKGN